MSLCIFGGILFLLKILPLLYLDFDFTYKISEFLSNKLSYNEPLNVELVLGIILLFLGALIMRDVLFKKYIKKGTTHTITSNEYVPFLKKTLGIDVIFFLLLKILDFFIYNQTYPQGKNAIVGYLLLFPFVGLAIGLILIGLIGLFFKPKNNLLKKVLEKGIFFQVVLSILIFIIILF